MPMSLLRFKKLISQRGIKFLGVGLLNTAFGYSTYAIFIFSGISYSIALLMATFAGITFNYFSFGKMVFQSRGGLYVFMKFVATYSAVYFINLAALGILTNDFHFGPYAGQIICIPLSVLLSWMMMNYWVYNRS